MLSIKNDDLFVEISLLGAEIKKVIGKTGESYMWSGDKNIWGSVSPVLFPVVGKSVNDSIKYENKKYQFKNHGFARHTNFKIQDMSENKVTLFIDSNMISIEEYPFEFRFSVTYRLEKNQLITEYLVENLSNKIMHFSLGNHPGFKCPFDENSKIEDYIIQFEHPEVLEELFVNEEALFKRETKELQLKDGIIQLNKDSFNKGALVYTGYKSQTVSLKEKKTNRKITVSLDGFKYLGFWAKPGANFVCIEPWCGIGDFIDFDGEISERVGNISLEIGGNIKKSYIINFDY
ncbi:MAG: aldose 1-epimerase family protein [Cetobacterium sp.]|uniref:aldose 1-epimerase family protein n=1 Tax=Cetobacterium sp. TaxID=2071632 RepID=UPI002FCC5B12